MPRACPKTPAIQWQTPLTRGLLGCWVGGWAIGHNRDLTGQCKAVTSSVTATRTAWGGADDFSGSSSAAVTLTLPTMPNSSQWSVVSAVIITSAGGGGYGRHWVSGSDGVTFQSYGSTWAVQSVVNGASAWYDVSAFSAYPFVSVCRATPGSTATVQSWANGIYLGSAGSSNAWPSSTFTIGNRPAVGRNFGGQISLTAVYGRILTEVEIQQVSADPFALVRPRALSVVWGVPAAAPAGNPWWYYAQQ